MGSLFCSSKLICLSFILSRRRKDDLERRRPRWPRRRVQRGGGQPRTSTLVSLQILLGEKLARLRMMTGVVLASVGEGNEQCMQIQTYLCCTIHSLSPSNNLFVLSRRFKKPFFFLLLHRVLHLVDDWLLHPPPSLMNKFVFENKFSYHRLSCEPTICRTPLLPGFCLVYLHVFIPRSLPDTTKAQCEVADGEVGQLSHVEPSGKFKI
jgi:hypothetical protein